MKKLNAAFTQYKFKASLAGAFTSRLLGLAVTSSVHLVLDVLPSFSAKSCVVFPPQLCCHGRVCTVIALLESKPLVQCFGLGSFKYVVVHLVFL